MSHSPNRREKFIGSSSLTIGRVLTFALVGIVGCAVDGEAEDLADSEQSAAASTDEQQLPQQDDGAPHMTPVLRSRELAKVELEGAVVTFVQPEEGGITVRERGRIESIGSHPAIDRRLTPTEQYTALTGNPPPQELVDAEAALALQDRSPREPRAAEPDFDPTQLPSNKSSNDMTHDQWKATLCDEVWRLSVHWINVYGRGARTWHDNHVFASSAYAIAGKVRFIAKVRTWYTWNDLAGVDLDAGWYESVYHNQQGGRDFDSKAIVDGADDAGDAYSLCIDAG